MSLRDFKYIKVILTKLVVYSIILVRRLINLLKLRGVKGMTDKEKLAKAEKMLEHWGKKTRTTRVNDFDNDELIQLYNEGVSLYALALYYNKGTQFIKSRLIRANVYKGSEHIRNEELNKKIREAGKRNKESRGV